MSGVTPQSTTAGLARNVEKESSRGPGSSALPGMFPETPSVEPPEFSVSPIPATSGVGNPVSLQPGQKVPDPSKLTSNTISSTVHDDMSLAKSAEDSQQTFGVAPIPATEGIGNPVHLQPGEKVPDPSSFTKNTINSTVTTDKKSFLSGSGAPQLPDVVTPQHERDARGGGMFSLPERTSNMIPESSLPMDDGGSSERDPGIHIQSAGPQSTTAQLAGNVPLEPRGVPDIVRESRDPGIHIQSAGPQSTTAQLAGNVPLEPRGVPDIVRESRAEAGFDPEASSNRAAVKEKSELEQELESKVPKEPSTAEGTSTGHGGTTDKKEFTGGQIAGMAAGGAVAGGAAVAGTLSTLAHHLPPSVQHAIDEMNRGISGSSTLSSDVDGTSQQHSGAAGMDKGTAIAPTVPEIVQESIVESHQSPEAAISEEVVGEKSEVEQELLHNVKREDASGEPAPTAGGSSTAAGGIHQASHQHSGSAGLGQGVAIAPTVPDVVQESIVESHQAPEAAAHEEIVGEKSVVEQELLRNVKREDASGEPAPSDSAALSETAPTTKTTTTALSEDKASLAAPSSAPARTPAASNAFAQAVRPREVSRDVSPMTRGPTTSTQAQPMVTSGVGSSTAPQVSQSTGGPSTPPKPTAASKSSPTSNRTGESSASTDKKSKRASGFFGKLKAKLSHDKEKK